ncbi:MAG: nucleotidyltransferase family protein [Planctomycetes bacterium]|nr:nucleotidyltransferase family protein [Planctomycetota bacterium]
MSPSENIPMLLRAKREDILRLAASHGARNIRIFGSVARGDAGPDSDLDVLVDMEPGRSLFDMGGLLMDLQDLLGCKVDVVTEKGLHWYVRARVLEEAVPL